MNTYFKLLTISFLLLLSTTAKSQVLISLLFGEALNTPKIEFGLVGGWNRSYILDIKESNGDYHFNIGFYFHILAKGNGYISTGVLVKSTVGATGMSTYEIGDDDFDNIYQDGNLRKEINYFYVPAMWQQRFNDNRWYIEGGIQLGLRNKAYDIFEEELLGGDLQYKLDVRDQYKHLDAGVIGGAGYKFKKEIKSLAVGMTYYYGLANVSEVAGTTIKNSSLNLYLKIPIGAGGKDKKKKQKG